MSATLDPEALGEEAECGLLSRSTEHQSWAEPGVQPHPPPWPVPLLPC